MVQIEFINFASKDDFLIKNYFPEFNKDVDITKLNNIECEHFVHKKLMEMVDAGICTDDVTVSFKYKTNTIVIDAKKRGISFGTTFNTDKSQSFNSSIINPMGEGGKLAMSLSLDLIKRLNCDISYTDRFTNKISVSKNTQPCSEPEKTFKIEEESITFSPPPLLIGGLPHYFSIYGGKRRTTVDSSKNQYPEQFANATCTSKLSLIHIYKTHKYDTGINPNKGLFYKIQNELSIPKFSDVPLFKSFINTNFIIPLKFGLRLHLSSNIGAIYNPSKKSMTPTADRFYNGKSYILEGFMDSGLSTSRLNTPYLGGDFYYTNSISLVKPFSEQFNMFCFGSMGNSTLHYGDYKTTFNNLLDPNNIRASIGAGLLVDLGAAFVKISFIKPLLSKQNDVTKVFGFDFQTKI